MIEKEQMIDTIPDSLLRPGIDDPSRWRRWQPAAAGAAGWRDGRRGGGRAFSLILHASCAA